MILIDSVISLRLSFFSLVSLLLRNLLWGRERLSWLHKDLLNICSFVICDSNLALRALLVSSPHARAFPTTPSQVIVITNCPIGLLSPRALICLH